MDIPTFITIPAPAFDIPTFVKIPTKTMDSIPTMTKDDIPTFIMIPTTNEEEEEDLQTTVSSLQTDDCVLDCSCSSPILMSPRRFDESFEIKCDPSPPKQPLRRSNTRENKTNARRPQRSPSRGGRSRGVRRVQGRIPSLRHQCAKSLPQLSTDRSNFKPAASPAA